MNTGSSNRRLHPRYSAPFRVVISGDEVQQMQLMTDDVSGSGLFLATNHELPVGSPLQLSIHLPDGKREVCCRGSIVRRAVNDQEGRQGYGVQLEFEQAEQAVEYLQRIDALATGQVTQDFDTYRVLLIEDNLLMSRMIENTLPRAWRRHFRLGPKLCIDTAGSGEQGLRMLEQQPYHLVITDMYMPGMDGLEVARQIRGMYAHRETPVLLLSGVSFESSLESTDIDACLIKPVQQQTLLSTVQLLLAGRAQTNESEPVDEEPTPLVQALHQVAMQMAG